jgi:uncharacterized protein YbjT (DUF2867 family)
VRVILFGATGMIGQGVLRECLLDARVGSVLSIGRSVAGVSHAKLREIVQTDLQDYSAIASQLVGFDACFFCLGVSSTGTDPVEYERITYGIPVAAAETLVRTSPNMTFIYVSGAGTDSSERGRTRWARVKGRAENAILRLSFAAAYMFRPGFIQPLHGIRSRTRFYRVFYAVTAPILPVLRMIVPSSILTTEQIGRAMITVAAAGAPKRVLESADIFLLSQMKS